MIVIFIELKPDVITHHASVFLCSMDRQTANSSSSTPGFYWTECAVLSNDSNTVASLSAGFIVLFSTGTFETIIGFPLNIWLICHILNKRLLFFLQYCNLVIRFLIYCISFQGLGSCLQTSSTSIWPSYRSCSTCTCPWPLPISSCGRMMLFWT